MKLNDIRNPFHILGLSKRNKDNKEYLCVSVLLTLKKVKLSMPIAKIHVAYSFTNTITTVINMGGIGKYFLETKYDKLVIFDEITDEKINTYLKSKIKFLPKIISEWAFANSDITTIYTTIFTPKGATMPKKTLEKYLLSISFLFDYIIRVKNAYVLNDFHIKTVLYKIPDGVFDTLYVRMPKDITSYKKLISTEDYSNLQILNKLLDLSKIKSDNFIVINQIIKQYKTFTQFEMVQLLNNNLLLTETDIL